MRVVFDKSIDFKSSRVTRGGEKRTQLECEQLMKRLALVLKTNYSDNNYLVIGANVVISITIINVVTI